MKRSSHPGMPSKRDGSHTGAPKTRAAPTKAYKPLPDFLGGGSRIKSHKGVMVEVDMNMFADCDPRAAALVWKGNLFIFINFKICSNGFLFKDNLFQSHQTLHDSLSSSHSNASPVRRSVYFP
jgi:hypothetical protein